MKKVGFVGPEESVILKAGLSLEYIKQFCKKLMLKELKKGDYIFVSGRCPKKGIDVMCEEIADSLGIHKEIYPAEVNQWEDEIFYKTESLEERYKSKSGLGTMIRLKGYRSRNIQIAEACDILYDIEYKGSCRHCGGRGLWLLDMKTLHEFGGADRICKFCKGTGNYSGGTWTINEAKRLGKEVYQIVIE